MQDGKKINMVCEFFNFLFVWSVVDRCNCCLHNCFVLFFLFCICFLFVMIWNGPKTVIVTTQWKISLVGKNFRRWFMAYTMQKNVENFVRLVLRWKDLMWGRSLQSKISSEKKPLFFNKKVAFSQWIMRFTSVCVRISLVYVVMKP